MNGGGARALVALVMGVVLAACAPGPLAAPDVALEQDPTLAAPAADAGQPAGRVVVAYPDEPSAFLRPVGLEPAVDDLAALWGLPLFRLDEAGQLRRGLVEDFEVRGEAGAGWQVALGLRAGVWSDGSPVEPGDVVASIDARRAAEPSHYAAIVDVAAEDDGVVVTFDRPYASWADLLVEVGTVLPAEVAGGDLSAFEADVPVSGGWFSLASYEPGLRAVFSAHPDGPLGAPGLAEVEVLFTPSYETSLGLLDDGTVDVVLGHLPINGVTRATDLEGVVAAAPLGGTTVSLVFREGGALGGTDLAERRRGVVETIDVGELVEGMLGPSGAVATTPWPGVDREVAPPVGEVREGQSLGVLVPGGGEVLGFTARAVQRDLVSRGLTVELVSEPAPRFARVAGAERDAALAVRRSPPRPSLTQFTSDTEVARAADAAGAGGAAARGVAAVAEEALVAPLFRVGVLHAWRGVEGVRPSSWVGAGFWSAGEWRTTDG